VALYPDYVREHYQAVTPNNFWTPEQTQAALAELGWSATTMAWSLFGISLVLAALSCFFGLFLLWRKADNWFVLFLSFNFLTIEVTGNLAMPVQVAYPATQPLFDFLGTVGWQLLFITFYLFPNGRFVPRWTRWMPLVWLVANLAGAMSIAAVGIGLVMTGLGSQIYRFFWRSTPLERQQTKLVLAVVILFVPFLLIVNPLIFRPPPPTLLGPALVWAMIGAFFFRFLGLLIPLAIFMSILRYRLWDVDVVIRKTLVYALLTGLLALVYLGSVLLLQLLFGRLVGEESPVIIVLSTLLIAALFSPMRRRLQSLIDRRFFRQKYDAQQVLADFATVARDEVVMERLGNALIATVQETMKPERASLWLRSASKDQSP
jgi:hypothetical protein